MLEGKCFNQEELEKINNDLLTIENLAFLVRKALGMQIEVEEQAPGAIIGVPKVRQKNPKAVCKVCGSTREEHMGTENSMGMLPVDHKFVLLRGKARIVDPRQFGVSCEKEKNDPKDDNDLHKDL